jgi:cell division inhibitor SulA
MQNFIDLLEKRQLIWHGRKQQHTPNLESSGYAELDSQLAGGFPQKGVVILHSSCGIGELRLLLPSLLNKSGLCIFINPPGLINAEFFYHQGIALDRILLINTRSANEALWSAEQCLKSGACEAVLLWQNHLEIHHVQRLQMASEQGECRQFIFRENINQSISLPVNLSLHLQAEERGMGITITKRKGGWPAPAFSLDMSANWPSLSCNNKQNVIPFPVSKTVEGNRG